MQIRDFIAYDFKVDTTKLKVELTQSFGFQSMCEPLRLCLPPVVDMSRSRLENESKQQ